MMEFQRKAMEMYPHARRISLCLDAEMRTDVDAYINRRDNISSKLNAIATVLITVAIVSWSSVLFLLYLTTYRSVVFESVGIVLGTLLFIAGIFVISSNSYGGKYSAVRQIAMEYGDNDACNILEDLSDIPASGWNVLVLDSQIYEYGKCDKNGNEDLIFSSELDSRDLEVLRDNPDDTKFYITWAEDKKNWRLTAIPKE